MTTIIQVSPEKAGASFLSLTSVGQLKTAIRRGFTLAYVSDPIRGGNYFKWKPSSEGLTVNNGTVFLASDGGFWVRIFEGPTLVDWFGAVGDGVHDDLGALNSCRDSLKDFGEMRLTGGKTYAISDTFEWYKTESTGTGKISLGTNGGMSKILGLPGVDVVFDLQGKEQTGKNMWFPLVENIEFSGPNGCQTIVRVGGGDTWHGLFRRCWFDSGIDTQQLVSITNTNVNNFRDYFTVFSGCVFRGAKHSIVIGGEFKEDNLVKCFQPPNRTKITDCDFYGYSRYGIFMSRAHSGDGTNGHTIKGVHFDSSEPGAIADIFWSSFFHHVEGVFESGAKMWIDFENYNVGGVLICDGLLTGSAEARFGLNGTPYTGNFPFPEQFNSLEILTNSSLGRMNIVPKVVTERIYGQEGQDLSVNAIGSGLIKFRTYNPSTNMFSDRIKLDAVGFYTLGGTGTGTDGTIDISRTFGLTSNTNVEVYNFLVYSSSGPSTNMIRLGVLTIFGTAGISQETTSLQENGSTDTITISRPNENIIRFEWTGFRYVKVRLTRQL